MPEQLHVTNLPCRNGEECSLIIPNASTQGPPTSRAVQVNPAKILYGSFTRTDAANRVRSATASDSRFYFYIAGVAKAIYLRFKL